MLKLVKNVLLAAIIGVALSASAQTLSGTLTNATTNKPAAGDSIELINISNGMDVASTTKADSSGKFKFSVSGPPGPHLVRATHQGVTYFQFAPPGTTNVDLKVYDVAKKVEGLGLTADVVRLQADSSSLQGVRLFAVSNTSNLTQMSDHNFEFYLPAGAKVLQVQAKAPNGQPIPAEAIPQSEKNRYAINFPLRPGETQFQLEFTLPYTGSLKIDPKPLYPAEHFVVMLPKSIHFTPVDASSFKSMQDPTQADSTVEVAQQTHVGQQLAFSISGTGTIPDQQGGGEQGGGASAQGGAQSGPMNENPQAESNRPGGGLGAPIDAPDPLEKYRWPIIGGFVVLLGIGGWYVTRRKPAAVRVTVAGVSKGAAESLAEPILRSGAERFAGGPLTAPITGPGASAIAGGDAAYRPAASASSPVMTAPAAATGATRSSALLEALKEELFQLEVERKQGKISAEEYEKAKSALDQTLERALKRQS